MRGVGEFVVSICHNFLQNTSKIEGPLTPHQGKTVEGTCLGGYVVERSLDLGEVSTC